ncbi:purine nucleoside transporter PunC [Paraferrimonas haliotis]|uniref:Bcr/CflA family efflux transporter n=1 Tax=Paraferrimonas haliotis TaxID=2013866 RepID=A0AA37TK19_9GAMM|nr:purine nucleoside transporter PunC [Paraferrimonas haliotis]GLS82912.1 Bcr/CflA family drug resistance efflux transporter [Paraferrimonas haliotis]
MSQPVKRFSMFWFAGLSMLGFIATDMYLPAFEALQAEFETSQALIALTLSVFLLGMAAGQLVYGPLSDRFGRKRVLAFGLSVFAIASVGCAYAETVEQLICARFLQALGVCSATVIWQAVVIDRYQGKAAERIFATIMPLVALSPALAPLLGAYLQQAFGWRVIFLLLVGFAIVLLFMTSRETESAPRHTLTKTAGAGLIANYRALLSSRQFVGYMLMFSGCSAAFFAYLTGIPFVMAGMGYEATDIGWSFVPQTIAFLVGGFGCRSLLKRHPSERLILWGLALFMVSVAIIVVITLVLKPQSIVPILIPFCFMAIANGALYPLVINKALQPFKNFSATASGLLNFLQTLLCFAASALVSNWVEQHQAIAVAATMTLAALTVQLGYSWARKTQSEPKLTADL